MPQARTGAARERLRIVAAEFEARAEEIELAALQNSESGNR
ncbi:MAG TPA: hypothetical protein VGR91_03170 [Stellaceae bacterium]|nr:hypothetical protein [Stellaceae bacterium]